MMEKTVTNPRDISRSINVVIAGNRIISKGCGAPWHVSGKKN